jgi:hypothetical protein
VLVVEALVVVDGVPPIPELAPVVLLVDVTVADDAGSATHT